MTSLVIYGNEFARYLDQGLAAEQFRWRFLVEGDSWMERSAVVAASLPHHLAGEFDDHYEPVLIVNLAQFGDTLRHMGDMLGGELAGWLDDFAFDALLLSAGGNDFIDAARDPDPGQGLLTDLRGQVMPAFGRDAVRRDAVAMLVGDYLDPNFDKLYAELRGSVRNAATPMFLNLYDTPVARHAPAFPGGRSWLHEAYRKNGIDDPLWPDLTDSVFDDLQTTIRGWLPGRQGVHLVPTDGRLRPADPADGGSSGDWLNEIHPNRAGWRKLAPVWRDTIRGVLAP
jgi:hypothetical protein